MTRSICLALFFVLILGGVFWFTRSGEVRPASEEKTSLLQILTPRVQVASPDREGAASKFQFAISTDPSALNQLNREAATVSNRVRPAVVQVSTEYPPEAPAKDRKKGNPDEPRTWTSSGVVVGEGQEVLAMLPNSVVPLNVTVRFVDGSMAVADFVGRDDASQIVLLRLPSSAPVKPLMWRNRRSLEWGEHFYAVGNSAVHGIQMYPVMISGNAMVTSTNEKIPNVHYRQLDAVLPPDFRGAVLVDGTGQLAGLVVRPDAVNDVRAVVMDGGSIRAVAEALRSLRKEQ